GGDRQAHAREGDGADGDPARGRPARGRAAVVPRAARGGRASRAQAAVDGHERRFRGGGGGRRDDGARGHGDLWIPAALAGGARVSVQGKRVGFIGGGNMGEALIRGLVGANLVKPTLITATDVRPERTQQLAQQYGVTGPADHVRGLRAPDVVTPPATPQ